MVKIKAFSDYVSYPKGKLRLIYQSQIRLTFR